MIEGLYKSSKWKNLSAKQNDHKEGGGEGGGVYVGEKLICAGHEKSIEWEG